MPVYQPQIKPPIHQIGGHLQTILPNVARKVSPLNYQRQRLELPDGDFLDLDFAYQHNTKGMLIIGHGLEGNSSRVYVRGIAHYFGQRGYAICAINFRSCSGELNRLKRMYHHGDYPDLQNICTYLKQNYGTLPLHYVGFSMGGNIGLNYVSRCSDHARDHLTSVSAYSSPLALGDAIQALDNPMGRMYSNRFRKSIGRKMVEKSSYHDIDHLDQLKGIKDWDTFDRLFSLPLHGYHPDACPQDFYDDVSPIDHLHLVQIPTLIVQAQNDPMLGGRCYDTSPSEKNDLLTFEIPANGGHVGFALAGKSYTYADQRTYDFVAQHNAASIQSTLTTV